MPVLHVRFWHICDMLSLSQLVRNTPQSGRVKRCYSSSVYDYKPEHWTIFRPPAASPGLPQARAETLAAARGTWFDKCSGRAATLVSPQCQTDPTGNDRRERAPRTRATIAPDNRRPGFYRLFTET